MEKIKQLRKERKFTQKMLATALNTFPQVISRYERGDREPDIEMLKKLADFFCVSIDYLVGATSHRVFESSAPNDVTKEELELLTYYRGMSDSGRNSIMTTARSFYNLVCEKEKKVN